MSAFRKIGVLAVVAVTCGLINFASAEGVGTAGGMQEYGPLEGYIQWEGSTITPNPTINAQPACHVQSRYLCKAGNSSCDVPVRRCGQNETRRQTGVLIFCDRWVCN